MSKGSSYSAFPQGGAGTGGEPERTVGGFGRPLRGGGFDGAKPTCHTDPARYAALVPPKPNTNTQQHDTAPSTLIVIPLACP